MASALANQKKLMEAVQLIQQKLHHCFSRKETLTWRLALSQILIESRRLDLALPHLDLILNDIDTFQLASWDPGLALKGLKLVWTGFSSHEDNQFQKNAETILNQIAELDPVEALTLKK
jgi:type VI secretion system protein VasJ